ncbi:MAG: hypothetical protein ABI644_03860 [Arenimonas sp.]
MAIIDREATRQVKNTQAFVFIEVFSLGRLDTLNEETGAAQFNLIDGKAFREKNPAEAGFFFINWKAD